MNHCQFQALQHILKYPSDFNEASQWDVVQIHWSLALSSHMFLDYFGFDWLLRIHNEIHTWPACMQTEWLGLNKQNSKHMFALGRFMQRQTYFACFLHATGHGLCSFSVGAAPHIWAQGRCRHLLSGVLHASPSTEAGGSADSQCNRPRPRPRHAGPARLFLAPTALEICRVVLQHPCKPSVQKTNCPTFKPAFGRAASGAALVPEPLGPVRSQDQCPGDRSRRSVHWIPELRYHPSAAVPRGCLEHLQGQQLPPSA